MPAPGLNMAAWESELDGDVDKQFLLAGIRNGFDIIDNDTVITPAKCGNHPSAQPDSPLYEKATKQVLTEIELGNYVVAEGPNEPCIISPMAAIPKPDGGVRLIHDCSRPDGLSVNDHCSTDWKQKIARIDDAAKLMSPGCFFAKVDLKSAYRSVSIGKHSQNVTGFQWNINGENITLRDTKLPFGAKLAPGIFHRITQAVKRMMARRGYDLVVVYLDDFLIVSESFKQCAEALQCLIRLLRRLGFAIHWGKVVDPTAKIVFLGIELDSVEMALRLPDEKLGQLTSELRMFLSRKRASKRQFQSLAGRLSWAASVVRGGRVFLRRIFNQIGLLKHNSHRAQLSVSVKQDLRWWHDFLRTFNGRSMLLDQQPIECVYTDACTDGAGGIFLGDWSYLNWRTD
ncbi:MAG: reverse transcriptase domain-containing protein [Sedimenticola sp.]